MSTYEVRFDGTRYYVIDPTIDMVMSFFGKTHFRIREQAQALADNLNEYV